MKVFNHFQPSPRLRLQAVATIKAFELNAFMYDDLVTISLMYDDEMEIFFKQKSSFPILAFLFPITFIYLMIFDDKYMML